MTEQYQKYCNEGTLDNNVDLSLAVKKSAIHSSGSLPVNGGIFILVLLTNDSLMVAYSCEASRLRRVGSSDTLAILTNTKPFH